MKNVLSVVLKNQQLPGTHSSEVFLCEIFYMNGFIMKNYAWSNIILLP